MRRSTANNRPPFGQQRRQLCVDIGRRTFTQLFSPRQCRIIGGHTTAVVYTIEPARSKAHSPMAGATLPGIAQAANHRTLSGKCHTTPVIINPRPPIPDKINNGLLGHPPRRGNHDHTIRRLDAQVHILDGFTHHLHFQPINLHAAYCPSAARHNRTPPARHHPRHAVSYALTSQRESVL